MKTPFHKVEISIPTYWSPEEALAVFDLIDDLRKKIWDRYRLQLQCLIPQEQDPASANPSDIAQGKSPL